MSQYRLMRVLSQKIQIATAKNNSREYTLLKFHRRKIPTRPLEYDILKARRNLQLSGLIRLERGGNYSSIRTRIQRHARPVFAATDIPRRKKYIGLRFSCENFAISHAPE